MDDSREYENTVNNEEQKKEPSSGNNAPELSSQNSDDDVINRLYTEYSDFNKDRFPSFVDTPEFEKSAEDFSRIKRLLYICFPASLFFPVFLMFYFYTLTVALSADYRAYSFIKNYRTSALYKDIVKLCLLHLCEFCVSAFMFGLIIHGCFGNFYGKIFILTAIILMMISCFSWPLALKTSEKFRNREPEIQQSTPIVSVPKYELAIKIYGVIIVMFNFFLAVYLYNYYEGLYFNTRYLPELGPALREYRQCVLDNGGLKEFEEGVPLKNSFLTECGSINDYRTENITGVHAFREKLSASFFFPMTSYTAILFYQTVNGEKTLIWKASPKSSCAEKTKCLEPDPNLL